MINDTLNKISEGDFFLIAGPCVIESEELCSSIAEHVSFLAEKYSIPYIFKSSFKKANRTSINSFTGPEFDKGLEILKKIRTEFEIPVLTDIHETNDVEAVAE